VKNHGIWVFVFTFPNCFNKIEVGAGSVVAWVGGGGGSSG